MIINFNINKIEYILLINTKNNNGYSFLIKNIKTDWRDIIGNFDCNEINDFLNKELEKLKGEIEIFPPRDLIFNCFNFFNIKDKR